THSPSLSEHLEWQLSMCDMTESEMTAAKCIVGNLDADGRLRTPVEEIASMARCTAEKAESARQIVLYLDPVGCGAFDVKESLLAQLTVNGEGESLAAEIVRNHFEDMQPHRLSHLAKSTGRDVHELDREIQK